VCLGINRDELTRIFDVVEDAAGLSVHGSKLRFATERNGGDDFRRVRANQRRAESKNGCGEADGFHDFGYPPWPDELPD